MSLAIREADTTFAELICADPQWLREEFDDLISASFGSPPEPPLPAPPRVPPRDHPWTPPSGPRTGPLMAADASARAALSHRRQRSPPA